MADGSIKISTKIGTEGFEKGKKRLEQGLAQLSNSMRNLERSTFGVDKAASRAFESARLKAQDTEIAISEIEKKMEAVREASRSAGVESSKAFQKAKTKADELNGSLAEMYAQRDAMAQAAIQKAAPPGVNMAELPDSFIDKTISQDVGIKEIDKQIARTETQLAKYQAQMKGAKLSADGLTDEAERELNSLQKKLDGLNVKLLQYRKRMEEARNGTGGFSGVMDKTKKSFQGLFKESERTGKQMGNTGKMIKGMLLSMVLFSSVMLIMRAINEGLQDMAQASGSANQVLSNLTTNFLYLKNSIAAALMPVLQALSPLIIMITDNLAALFNMVGMVTARIFGGATTIIKAKKAQVDYAKTLDKTGASAKKAANALATFDDLDVLQQKTDDGMPSYANMFEEVEIPENVISFVDKMKNAFDKILDPLRDINFDNLEESLGRLKNALVPFTEKIFAGLSWGYYNIFVPLSRFTIEKVIPKFLDILADSLDILNSVIDYSKPALQWLWDNFLKPLSRWTGTTLTNDLDEIHNILSLIKDLLEGDLKQAASDAGLSFDGLGQHFKDMVSALPVLIGGWRGAIQLIMIKMAEELKDWFTNDVKPWFSNNVWDPLWSGVKQWWSNGWASIKQGWDDNIGAWWENSIAPWFTQDKWDPLWKDLGQWWSNGWQGVSTWWNTAIGDWWTNNVAPWFTASKWTQMMRGVGDGFYQTFYNAVESARNLFNKFIDWLNDKMRFTWDDLKIGGKKILSGGSIQLFKISHIPQLATGAVIPPNNEFLALLGDQKSGTNIEAPLDTIIKGVMTALDAKGIGAGNTNGVNVNVSFTGSLAQLGRVLQPVIKVETDRKGVSLVNG